MMTRLLQLLATVRWQDLVDILINSYILFRVYVLFQGTNAFRVLAGVTSLWILQEAAASIGLILTSWAVRGITAAAAIIIIVVFRNEIRAALQLGNLKTFLWGFPHRETRSPVEMIADAAFRMAKKRIGALMVIPGKEDLTEVIHGGIVWNGTVSPEMIISIFWPKNPVHDGAIIIRGNSVVEVGVLLPLSQRSDLPSFYGTRHRAAAGLAERTDALVIAVSEERGRVTIAKSDWIKAIAQPEDLAGILRRHLNLQEGRTAKHEKKERLKLALAATVSLLIMTGIWFGFTRSHDTIIALNVPIEYVNRPTNLEILETSVDEARLQLYGSSALIKSLKPGQVQVKMDLGKAAEGRNIFTISHDNVVLPPGIFLNKVQPSSIDVTLDVPVTAELPIQVDWVGRLPENLTLVKARIIPETVKVIGGSQTIEKANTVYTTSLRLDSLTKSGTTTASLAIPPSLKLFPGAPDKVTITYVIKERPADQRR